MILTHFKYGKSRNSLFEAFPAFFMNNFGKNADTSVRKECEGMVYGKKCAKAGSYQPDG